MSALTELLKPSEIAEVVAFLRELATKKVSKNTEIYGICEHLSGLLDSYYSSFVEHDAIYKNIIRRFQFWPPYSRHPRYPVPSTCCRSPVRAYGRFNRWGPTKYGDLRRSLCAFLADHIEKYPDFDPEREAPTREAAE